ncbi:hypothetical protein [Halopelagius fulvigenes]|uniref:Uncharacterized protein n=1 Tax=Halopelagius fulvigenes TaxID=1198324 RepID=A0ABD5U3G4_9EURY
MPSANAEPRSARELGPIRLLDTSRTYRFLGFALAFVALQIGGWAAESASLVPTVAYATLAGFVALNGLYLGGVRFR